MGLLAERGVEETWRRSIAEALDVIELFDERLALLERELRQTAKADTRVVLLKTIPGVGDLLGDRRARSATSAASPRRARDRLRRSRAAREDGEALDMERSRKRDRARCAGPPSKRHTPLGGRPTPASALQRARQARRQEPRQVVGRPQGPHCLLAHPQPPTTLQARPLPDERHRRLGKLPLLSGRLTAPHGIEKPRQLPRTICATSAEEKRATRSPNGSTNDRAPPG